MATVRAKRLVAAASSDQSRREPGLPCTNTTASLVRGPRSVNGDRTPSTVTAGSGAGDCVDMHRFSMHGIHVGALEAFTDLRGNPLRPKITGSNEADDTVDLRVCPGPPQRRCRRLRRKAVAPSSAMKHPAEVDAGPWLLRMVKPDAADDLSGRLLDDAPLTISAQFPVAKHAGSILHRHIKTAGRFFECDLLLLHDLRIPEDRHEDLCIGQLRHAQHEAR